MSDTPRTDYIAGIGHHSPLIDFARELEREIERLKSGRFTPEEFQNLCHTQSEENRRAFFRGCRDYQRQLFGSSDRDRLQTQIKEQREEAERVRREVKAAWELLHKSAARIQGSGPDEAFQRLERALDITGEYARENKARQKQAIASDSKSP